MGVTSILTVQQFAKGNFSTEYILRLLHRKQYMTNLRRSCYWKKINGEATLRSVQHFGDRDLLQKVDYIRMPSCDTLQELEALEELVELLRAVEI
jgi:uncharacterized protein YpiB (UPF0302 family)